MVGLAVTNVCRKASRPSSMASCKAEYRSRCARPALTASGRYSRISATFTRAKRCARRCRLRSAGLSASQSGAAGAPARGGRFDVHQVRADARLAGRAGCRALRESRRRLEPTTPERRCRPRRRHTACAYRGPIHRQRKQVRLIAGCMRRKLPPPPAISPRRSTAPPPAPAIRWRRQKPPLPPRQIGFAKACSRLRFAGAAHRSPATVPRLILKNGAGVGERRGGIAQDGGDLGKAAGLPQAPHRLVQMFGEPARRPARWSKHALPFLFGTTAPVPENKFRSEGEGAAVDIL